MILGTIGGLDSQKEAWNWMNSEQRTIGSIPPTPRDKILREEKNRS
jgi:hypothetical protein